MPKIATDPPTSEAQRRAMWAAAEGRSNLGIPQKVGKEFVGKDMKPEEWRTGLRWLMKFFSEEMKEPEHQAADEDFKGAAGVLVRHHPTGDCLFLKRSAKGDQAGTWCLPFGGADAGETPAQTAARELKEETGLSLDELYPLHSGQTPSGILAHTFVADVDEKFDPQLSDEHTEFRWAALDDLPEPMELGAKAALDQVAKDKALPKGRLADAAKGAADALPDGLLLAMDRSRDSVGLPAFRHGIAFDRDTARMESVDGHLHVMRTPISKAAVNEYLGEEIPGFEELGLDPRKRYRLLRDPEELKKAAPTFNNKPLLSDHIPVTAKDHPKELVVGATGSAAEFDFPFLFNDLVFWPEEAIEDVKSERKRELSSAYHYVPIMEPGVFTDENGAEHPYDGRMTQIVGNHVAQVPLGRAGHDVMVADAALDEFNGFRNFVSAAEFDFSKFG
jgi:uncharacterized protein